MGYCGGNGINPQRVYVSGSYAYLAGAGSNPGLHIVDISDPTNPYEVGFCSTPNTAWDVHISGSYAYIADAVSGLQIINIADPSNPYIIGADTTSNRCYGVCVENNFAYTAEGNSQLHVIDITDPSNPHQEGFHDTPTPPRDIFIKDSLIFVSDGLTGLQIYKNLLLPVKENPVRQQIFFLKLPAIISKNIKIKFHLSKSANVALSIYDISGCLVKNFSGLLSKGEHTLYFEQKTSGVYFYVFKAGEIYKKGKFVIVK